MDNQVFYTVVVPTLITGAAFIGITTLGEDSNFVDTLIDIKRKDGKPLFKSIKIDMVCDDCKREGLELKCQHKNGDMPHWQSQGRASDIESMMEGQESTHLLETKGIRGTGQWIKFFEPKKIDHFASQENDYSATGDIDKVYIAIDPSAGGKKSNYALVSCIYDGPKMVVVGAESGDRIDVDNIIRMVVNHIHSLRKIRSLSSAQMIIIPENNLGNEASWLESGLLRIRELLNWRLVHEDVHDRAGFRTTNDTKCLMAYDFAYKLNEENLHFHEEFVCNGDGKYKSQELIISKMKKNIVDQTRNYARKVEQPKNLSGKCFQYFSGKEDGMGLDDHIIAIQLNLIVYRLLSVNGMRPNIKNNQR